MINKTYMMILFTHRLLPVLLAGLFGLIAGCASVAHMPATLNEAQGAPTPAPVTVTQSLSLSLDTGFTRTIAAGSRWQQAGSIAQGAVYRPLGAVLTVEGAHIHEAYLVVEQNAVVGFYLPAERGFSPLKQRSAITFH